MIRPVVAASLALVLSACNGGSAPQVLPANWQSADRHASRGKIKHVVIIVQENRSFNNLFFGFPHAKTVKYGVDSKNHRVELVSVPLEALWDLDHSSNAFFAAC